MDSEFLNSDLAIASYTVVIPGLDPGIHWHPPKSKTTEDLQHFGRKHVIRFTNDIVGG